MSYLVHSLGERSYASAEMQSMYFTAPADWDVRLFSETKERKKKEKPQDCRGTCYLVIMLSPPKFNVEVLYSV